MPLQRTRQAAIVALGSASFFMADDQRTVRVDVSKELLVRMGSSLPQSGDEYIWELNRYRRQFEQIAAAKYDEGLFHYEVRVLVVQITEADLAENDSSAAF